MSQSKILLLAQITLNLSNPKKRKVHFKKVQINLVGVKAAGEVEGLAEAEVVAYTAYGPAAS